MPWKTKTLIFSHLLIVFLISSLFLEPYNSFWTPIDVWFFRLVNSFIQNSHFWQNFWAIANHRLTDFFLEDLGFILFFAWILYATPKVRRTRKTAECLFVLLYAICIILVTNELLFRTLLNVQRKSPSWVLDSFTYLPEKVTWLKTKTRAAKSFPGDHATTTLISIVGFFYLARGLPKIQWITTAFGLFLTLPRLVVGAHWLTDALIGSGSIVLFFSSWAFFSPFGSSCVKTLENLLKKLKRKNKATPSTGLS